MSYSVETVESVPIVISSQPAVGTTYVYQSQSGGSLGGNAVSGGQSVTYTYTESSSSSSGGAAASSSSGNLGGGLVYVSGGGASSGVSNVLVSGSSSSGNLGGGSVYVSGGGAASGVSNVLISGSSSGNALANGGSFVISSGGASQSAASNIAADLLSLNAAGAGSGAGSGSVTVISSQSGSSGGVLEASAFSQVEQAILRATNPFEIQETEVITVNGETGIWANKQEVVNWRGVIPLTEYLINQDQSPEIIRKRTEQLLTYEQEVAIRYLRPPTPPPPGEIIIKQEKNILTPPAPPLVIRQQPPRPETPQPLLIREAPPRPPVAIGQKVITISGKRLPPPPRKVIIERLAPLPNKPQSYIIERWLPYRETKRRVIFQGQTEQDPVIPKPRNVIVQWDAPQVQIRKQFKDLGVIRANPVEYVQRYGASLKQYVELPDFVREIRPPTGVVLASEFNASSLFDLEGDVQALKLIDLDREGLGEYKSWLSKFLSGGSGGWHCGVNTKSGSGLSFAEGGSGSSTTTTVTTISGGSGGFGFASDGGYGSSVTFTSNAASISSGDVINSVLLQLFGGVDGNSDARIVVSEAENAVFKINQGLNRNYTKEDAAAFFRRLDSNKDGRVDYKEFRSALLNEFSLRA